MANWANEELTAIDSVDELRISTQRSDGTLRKPVIIWSVRVGDNLFVRAVRGIDGLWYRHAVETGLGAISAGGVERDVALEREDDPAINAQIDNAFQVKYARYAKNIIDSTQSNDAREATLKVSPQ